MILSSLFVNSLSCTREWWRNWSIIFAVGYAYRLLMNLSFL